MSRKKYSAQAMNPEPRPISYIRSNNSSPASIVTSKYRFDPASAASTCHSPDRHADTPLSTPSNTPSKDDRSGTGRLLLLPTSSGRDPDATDTTLAPTSPQILSPPSRRINPDYPDCLTDPHDPHPEGGRVGSSNSRNSSNSSNSFSTNNHENIAGRGSQTFPVPFASFPEHFSPRAEAVTETAPHRMRTTEARSDGEEREDREDSRSAELHGVDTGGRGVDTGGRGVDTGCRGVDTGGRVVDAGGRGVDTGGRGVDTGGRGVDTGGRGVDTGGDKHSRKERERARALRRQRSIKIIDLRYIQNVNCQNLKIYFFICYYDCYHSG
jgi:hypothetical protein